MLTKQRCSTLTVGDIGSGNTDSMRQALAVYRNMALNPWYFLSCVIAFVFSRVGIFYALSINDDKTGFALTVVLLSRFFDQFFLRPCQEGCCLLRQAHSISESTSGRCAIWESHGAAVAIGNLFLVHTITHKIRRKGQPFLVWSSSLHFLEWVISAQIVFG